MRVEERHRLARTSNGWTVVAFNGLPQGEEHTTHKAARAELAAIRKSARAFRLALTTPTGAPK